MPANIPGFVPGFLEDVFITCAHQDEGAEKWVPTAYLPGLANDIFINCAHADNAEGWYKAELIV